MILCLLNIFEHMTETEKRQAIHGSIVFVGIIIVYNPCISNQQVFNEIVFSVFDSELYHFTDLLLHLFIIVNVQLRARVQ